MNPPQGFNPVRYYQDAANQFKHDFKKHIKPTVIKAAGNECVDMSVEATSTITGGIIGGFICAPMPGVGLIIGGLAGNLIGRMITHVKKTGNKTNL